MRLQGSLACLLLTLCLGSGGAGPLLQGGEGAGAGVGEAVGHGMGDAIGQGVGDAISQGVEEAVGQGTGGSAGSASREAMSRGMEEAAQVLRDPGGEAGRQAENIIRQGADAAHSSWQGVPGGNGAWGTNGQPPSGGHDIFGSQGGSGAHSHGNPGGLGTPWDHGYPGGSNGGFGTHPQGGPWGQGANGGSPNWRPNAQGAVVQPGYGSVRGGGNSHTECTNAPPAGSGGSSGSSGGSGGSSGGDSSGSGGGSSGGSGGSSGGSGGSSGSSGGSGGSSSGTSWGYNSGSSSSSSGGGSSGGNKPECDSSGNGVRMSGGSGGQGSRGGQGGPSGSGDLREISKEGGQFVGGSQGNYQGSSGRGEAVSGIDTLNSQTSPGLFNFETFWKNFKSKLGFINWDAINKGADASSLQKRSGGAGQSDAGWEEVAAVTSKNNYKQKAYPTPSGGQYSAKIPSKGGATPSSSASRVQPGLLQWVKVW
ncbi:dermokine isoform X3 [Suricata suricatta]|uniref:dermokine isoform X3 n=1 Tax=Suricata suricatta TaxID=37032 RepID=UPI001155FC8A|nr:dermokine isoform X3 [Suricata suricatta]